MGAAMPFYRLYTLDRMGRIRLADWIKARDDAQAIASARRISHGARMCEVWLRDRRVAILRDHERVG